MGKKPQLARRHGQRAAPQEGVFKPHQRLTPQTAGLMIQGFDPLHLEYAAQLQVILQVCAHPWQIQHHGNTQFLQQRCIANPGALENGR